MAPMEGTLGMTLGTTPGTAPMEGTPGTAPREGTPRQPRGRDPGVSLSDGTRGRYPWRRLRDGTVGTEPRARDKGPGPSPGVPSPVGALQQLLELLGGARGGHRARHGPAEGGTRGVAAGSRGAAPGHVGPLPAARFLPASRAPAFVTCPPRVTCPPVSLVTCPRRVPCPPCHPARSEGRDTSGGPGCSRSHQARPGALPSLPMCQMPNIPENADPGCSTFANMGEGGLIQI